MAHIHPPYHVVRMKLIRSRAQNERLDEPVDREYSSESPEEAAHHLETVGRSVTHLRKRYLVFCPV